MKTIAWSIVLAALIIKEIYKMGVAGGLAFGFTVGSFVISAMAA